MGCAVKHRILQFESEEPGMNCVSQPSDCRKRAAKEIV